MQNVQMQVFVIIKQVNVLVMMVMKDQHVKEDLVQLLMKMYVVVMVIVYLIYSHYNQKLDLIIMVGKLRNFTTVSVIMVGKVLIVTLEHVLKVQIQLHQEDIHMDMNIQLLLIIMIKLLNIIYILNMMVLYIEHQKLELELQEHVFQKIQQQILPLVHPMVKKSEEEYKQYLHYHNLQLQ